MALDDLKEVIEKLQGRITNHKDYLQKEPRTRTLLVDPLLRELGWDVEDPNLVELEYEPESSKRMSADYILKNGKNQVAIVEVKPMGKAIENLEVLEQADKYASSAGAPFIILTNGVKWLLYERSPTAGLASLDPIVSFDLAEEPYRCALQALSMWNLNLASDNPIKVTKPVLDAPDKKTAKAAPVPDPAPKPEKGKKTPTRLVVTMLTGEKIAHSNASNTFVEVIQKLGIPKVENLNKMHNNSPLISTADNPTYTTRKLGKYFIITHSSTQRKKRFLEEIASALGVNLKVEIV